VASLGRFAQIDPCAMQEIGVSSPQNAQWSRILGEARCRRTALSIRP
jgi:hypothetical protein